MYAAADTLYKDGTNVTTTGTPSGGGSGSNEAIAQLTVGGVTIGDFGTPGGAGRVEATNVKISNNLTIGNNITISGSDGKLTVKAVRINGNNTVTGILRVSEIKGLDVIDSSSSTVIGQADLKINGTKFESNGAITATSLKLDGIDDVKTAINGKAAQTDVNSNKANIEDLKTSKADAANVYTKAESDGNFAGKAYESKVNALETTVGSDSSGLVKDVKALGDKTQNIKVAKDTIVTSSDATYIDGITHAGGVRLADKKVRAKEMVLEEKFANGTSAEAKLTREGLAALNSMVYDSNGKINIVDEKPIIQAGNGSVVGGVKLDNKNITNVDSITVNEGKSNQVKITSEGIVVGLTSAAINGDGFYAGGHNYNDAKAALDGKDGKIKGAGGKFGVDEYGNVTTTGDIKGKDVTVDGKLSANGDAVVGGDLSVAGKANFAKEATFAGGITTDAINEATPDKGVTIDGVLLKDGGVNASAMSVTGATGSLNVKDIGGTSTMIYTKAADGTNTIWIDPATGNISTNGTLQVGGGVAGTKPSVTIDGATGSIKVGKNDTEKFAVDGTTGNVKTEGSLEVASNATVGGNIKGQSLNIGATGTEFTVDTVGHMTSKSAQIGSVGITNTGVITGVTSLTTGALTVTGAFTTGGNLTVTGDLEASGAIKGKTISITNGGSIAGVNFATGGNLTAATGTIAGVSFTTGGVVSGVKDFTSTIIRDGAGTIITNGNVESKTANIGAISIVNETIEGSSANGLAIEGVKIKDGVVSDVTSLTANSATIGGVNTLDNTGISVGTGKKIQVGVNTKIEDGAITVSSDTKLTDRALTLNTNNTWTADGGLVADKATVNGVVLGADATKGKATFTDAAGKVTTIAGDTITTGTITAGELLVDSISLGKDPANKNITIGSNGDIKTNGDITVTGADGDTTVIDGAQATFGNDAINQTIINKGDINATAKNAADAQQSTLTHNNKGFKVEGKDASGTKASSFGFDTSTGIGTFTGQDSTTTAINGSNLTLTNGANSTALTAGGATFTGAAGEKGGNTTTIAGGTITTDTLNVERINLGGEVIDKGAAGVEANSKLYMDAQGNFRAAGGNFKVNGADGAMTNTVGNTTLKTDNAGASMNYAGTANSNISVADGKAEMAVGANAAVTATDGKVEIKGGTQTVTTTDAGTVFANGSSAVRPGGVTTTTINGNEITTGKLTTDQLVITGSGAAAGTGSGTIALGGDGSIKSNIKDGNDESTFETKANNIKSEVTDGTYTATHNVAADKIGSVITGGTVELRQELDANTGKITNKAGDMSTELDNNGFTVKQNGKTDVKIADGDVTVTNNKNAATPDQEVHLSDLGSLNNLDGELTARDEYKNNETAVGAINAEAGIRREEVARLDNRIDDVNNRVDKVGAMAAAIASLKSIGYDPQAPSEFSIGLGQYKGETGVAMGFFHYPNKNFMINVSLSTAGGETMGGIGATWRFGHKSPQKLLDEQREAQARKELAAAEKYQAAAKLAKEAQERAEYAAKLARQAQVSADNAKAAADATQAKHFQ